MSDAATADLGARGVEARDGASAVEENPHREAWTALCHAHASLTTRLQESLTEAGLPPLAWYEVLDVVAGATNEGVKMGELASALIISRGGLTKLVDRLVKAGLIERAFCPTDRRVSHAVLTDTGREVYEEMRPIVIGELSGAFTATLSAREAATLRDALTKLTSTACSA